MSRSRDALTLGEVSGKALLIIGLVALLFLYCQGYSRAADTASFTVTPTDLDFGQVPVGTVSTPQYVIVLNTGPSKLSLTAVSNNQLFNFASTCHDLVPLQICSIAATFNPIGAVQVSGILTVTDTVSGVNQTVQLKGGGTGGSRTPPAPKTGRIFGQVTLDGTPLPAGTGVTLVLTGTLTSGSPFSQTAQTPDASGNYSFDNLTTGLYLVTVNTPAGFKVDLPASFTVDMSKDTGNAQANFNLTRSATTTPTALPFPTTVVARPTVTAPPSTSPPTVTPIATTNQAVTATPSIPPPTATPVGPDKVPVTGAGADGNFSGFIWPAVAILGGVLGLALIVILRVPRHRAQG